MTYSDVSKEHSNLIFNSWGNIRSSRTYQSWLWRCYTALKCQGTANYPLQSISSQKTSALKETCYSSLEGIKKIVDQDYKLPHTHHNARGTCVTLPE